MGEMSETGETCIAGLDGFVKRKGSLKRKVVES